MINLLPPRERIDIELSKKNSVLRRYVELLLLAVLIVFVVIAGSLYYLKQQENNTRQSLELNSEKMKELEASQEEAQQLSTTINTIAALLSRDLTFSAMLKDIGTLMPSGAVLSGLELSGTDTKAPLIVSARIENEQVAAVLRNNLANSELFDKAEIVSITKVGTENVSSSSSSSQNSQVDDKYKYTTLINAYFSTKSEAKQ